MSKLRSNISTPKNSLEAPEATAPTAPEASPQVPTAAAESKPTGLRTGGEEVISQLKTNLETMERALSNLDGVLLGQGHIVTCQGVPVRFEIVDGKAQNPQPCPPHMATRFTASDAKRIAESTRNGNNIPGETIHVKDALQQEIESIRGLLRNFLPVAVGRNDGIGEIKRFATLKEGEEHIATIEKTDPDGVHNGDYYIDAPEEMVNPQE